MRKTMRQIRAAIGATTINRGTDITRPPAVNSRLAPAPATEAQIAAAQGSDYMNSSDLNDRQKAAVRWAEAVTTMTARDDDAAFAEMKKHFSEKQIVELTVFCGMWNYSNRLCEALHVDLERPDKRIEFQK